MNTVNLMESKLKVYTTKIILPIALLMAIFHLYSAIIPVGLDPYLQRSIHLTFILSMAFFLFPFKLKENKSSILDVILAILGVGATLYITFNYQSIQLQAGLPTDFQTILAGIITIIIIEATRRTTGWALPIITICALLYGYLGHHIPGQWGHAGFSLDRMLGYVYLTDQGIWSTPIAVSATVLTIFIIFGSFLQKAKIERTFNDLSTAVAGGTAGGPAQTAVISSALTGTVNGSAVANVATTGTITIPMMIKRGYKPSFAAGVEATASTGGQLMPPIMGAGAFIMADLLGVGYFSVVIAALIPAILYFANCMITVQFEASRIGLKAKKRADRPSFRKVILEQGYMLIPLLVMIILIFQGFSPVRAGFWGIILVLIVASLKKSSRLNFNSTISALADGAKSVVPVATACACAGIVLGVLSMTGLGVKLGSLIIDLAGGSLIIALILAMLGALILGMGLPTAVAYVIAASSIAPAIIGLGVEPIIAHLFVFYFAILGTITPPVCLSVYTAAGIANTSWSKTAVDAIRIALPGFIIPYLMIRSEAFILVGEPLEIITSVVTALIGITSLAGSVIGYFLRDSTVIERIIMFFAAFCLMFPGLLTDALGISLLVIVIVMQKTLKVNEASQKEDQLAN